MHSVTCSAASHELTLLPTLWQGAGVHLLAAGAPTQVSTAKQTAAKRSPPVPRYPWAHFHSGQLPCMLCARPAARPPRSPARRRRQRR